MCGAVGADGLIRDQVETRKFRLTAWWYTRPRTGGRSEANLDWRYP